MAEFGFGVNRIVTLQSCVTLPQIEFISEVFGDYPIEALHGGMVMYVKRLEAGRFKLPEYDEATKSCPMEWRDLVVRVEGITEDPAARLGRLRAERTEYHV